jgi:hypothetical protein
MHFKPRWYNPNFTRELEEAMKELSERFFNIEFVVVGGMNSWVGMMQINLPLTAWKKSTKTKTVSFVIELVKILRVMQREGRKEGS